ncbi:MAG: hypothetical protein E5299_01976 [Burkholderia gladioli]|nr:MAG: hypothetical protein E5299_01976 [Burkholderia gladioli]
MKLLPRVGQSMAAATMTALVSTAAWADGRRYRNVLDDVS